MITNGIYIFQAALRDLGEGREIVTFTDLASWQGQLWELSGGIPTHSGDIARAWRMLGCEAWDSLRDRGWCLWGKELAEEKCVLHAPILFTHLWFLLNWVSEQNRCWEPPLVNTDGVVNVNL